MNTPEGITVPFTPTPEAILQFAFYAVVGIGGRRSVEISADNYRHGRGVDHLPDHVCLLCSDLGICLQFFSDRIEYALDLSDFDIL